MDGASLTRGKVVLVPFPFDDLSTTKVRPAVCSTDPVGAYRHVVLAFITSRTPDELLKTDVVLDTDRLGFTSTGLRVSSVLRLHRLMTVATSIIRRELGNLPLDVQLEVDRKLLKLLGLDVIEVLWTAFDTLPRNEQVRILERVVADPSPREELGDLLDPEAATEQPDVPVESPDKPAAESSENDEEKPS